MPRIPIDYSKTIIYQLKCKDDNITEIYVGSTTHFIKRKQDHKNCCNNPKNKTYNHKIYNTIREQGGWDNWRMIQVYEYPCNNKREAEHKEELVRQELKATLNSNRCWRPNDGICIEPNCTSSAQGKTDYCIAHGGGNRCIEPNCTSSARSKTDYCIAHGGGNRCIVPNCKSSAQGKTDYCVTHGGGNRCIEHNCTSSARSTTNYCIAHNPNKIKYTCVCGYKMNNDKSTITRHNMSKKHCKYIEEFK